MVMAIPALESQLKLIGIEQISYELHIKIKER